MNKKQREMVVSAMAKTLVIIYAVILIIGIAKAAAARSITAGFLELIFAVAVPILVYLFVRGRKKVTFPMTIAGMEVRPESSRKALRGRLRAYIRDSLPYAGAAALFLGAADIWQAGSSGTLAGWGLSGWLDILGSVLVEFIVLFAVCFAVDYVIYEWKAKKHMTWKRRRSTREKKYKAMMEDAVPDEQ